MYTITYSIDSGKRVQYSCAVNGKMYGRVYISKAAAQHDAEFLACEIDEDGSPYVSPIDFHVEEIEQHDFEARRQGIVIRCHKCHGKLNHDPFPLFSDLKKLTWDWSIDPEDFTHDAGCESVLLKHIPLPPDDPDKLIANT